MLDKGMSPVELSQLLTQGGAYVDIAKVGWGIGYIDPTISERVEMYAAAGVVVTLGGTFFEICAAQGRLAEMRRWAAGLGIHAVEVSDGLQRLGPRRKAELIRELAADFVVLAETGAKSDDAPVVTREWIAELESDLEAGATWLIAEGRESGSVGLYHADGQARDDLVEEIAARLPVDKVIFEAPRKAQQVAFVRRFGADVGLGNIPPEEVLSLETIRLGLRADTALADFPDGAAT